MHIRQKRRGLFRERTWAADAKQMRSDGDPERELGADADASAGRNRQVDAAAARAHHQSAGAGSARVCGHKALRERGDAEDIQGIHQHRRAAAPAPEPEHERQDTEPVQKRHGGFRDCRKRELDGGYHPGREARVYVGQESDLCTDGDHRRDGRHGERNHQKNPAQGAAVPDLQDQHEPEGRRDGKRQAPFLRSSGQPDGGLQAGGRDGERGCGADTCEMQDPIRICDALRNDHHGNGGMDAEKSGGGAAG